jgi:hypothetical protein
MSSPANIEELQALGTVVCPKCSRILDATDTQVLYDHIVKEHPEEMKKISINLLFDTLCQTGIIRRV